MFSLISIVPAVTLSFLCGNSYGDFYLGIMKLLLFAFSYSSFYFNSKGFISTHCMAFFFTLFF